jgi:hypothetical protein
MRSACDRVDKAREGFGCVIIGTYPTRQTRNLGGAKSQGGIRRGLWLIPKALARDPRYEQSPEAAMRRSRRVQSREGERRSRERTAFRGEKSLEGKTP